MDDLFPIEINGGITDHHTEDFSDDEEFDAVCFAILFELLAPLMVA